MVAQRRGPVAGRTPLCDDTEESVVGTPLHQITISALADALTELRRARGYTWNVGRNMGFRGFPQPTGLPYAPKPDVVVHPRALPTGGTEVTLAAYGPPHLVVEIASRTTVENDIGDKATSYALGGVAEYLVADVSGEGLLGGQLVVAWRLSPEGGGTLTPWLPEADGRWHSAWGFALGVQGLLVRVYTPEGVAVSTGHEHSLLRQEAERLRQLAEQREREEARRRQEAERREYEEALRRQEAEVAQAQAEAAQAQAERQRQEAERLRREAEGRAAALEVELRRLRGETP